MGHIAHLWSFDHFILYQISPCNTYYNLTLPTDHNFDILKSTLPQSFSFSGPVVLEKKILKDFFSIYFFDSPLWPYPTWGSWFEQFRIYTTPTWCFHTSLGFSGPVVLEKKIFPIYFYVKFWFLIIPLPYPWGHDLIS
jgi:hypothetical protein